MSLGTALKWAREDLGMTQQELADELQIACKRISDYEHDRIRPNRKLLEDIADILGVYVEDLICA